MSNERQDSQPEASSAVEAIAGNARANDDQESFAAADGPKFEGVVFDIETGPLPEERLLEIAPVFDPKSVKVGNLKDSAKIEAKIAASKKAHYDSCFERAALSPSTGQVLAIGFYDGELQRVEIIGQGNLDERDVLDAFWFSFSNGPRKIVGLNIHDFDLPFLVRRSWILDVAVPEDVYEIDGGRFWWNRRFIDLRKVWLCGQRPSDTKSSFDELSKAFETGGKPEGIDGSSFADLWLKDREKAIEYLTGDVLQPAIWARKMGVV